MSVSHPKILNINKMKRKRAEVELTGKGDFEVRSRRPFLWRLWTLITNPITYLFKGIIRY